MRAERASTFATRCRQSVWVQLPCACMHPRSMHPRMRRAPRCGRGNQDHSSNGLLGKRLKFTFHAKMFACLTVRYKIPVPGRYGPSTRVYGPFLGLWSTPCYYPVLLVGKWEGIRDMRLHPQNSIPSTPIPSRRRCRGWGPASLHIVSRPSEGCEWQSWLCQFMRLPLPSMLALSTNYRRCPCHRQYDAHGDNISTCRNHLATRTQATTTPWLAS